MARKKVLLVILGILLAVCAAMIVPWILIGVGLSLEKSAQDNERRHYVPKNLADAVKFEYATPAMITAFLDRGESLDQTIDVGNGRRWPLIRAASVFNSVEVTRLLIRRGATIGQAGLWSVLRQGREPMARMLIEEGAPLAGDQPDADLDIGPELVQAAVMGHQPWAVKLLLDKGAMLQLRNRRGDALVNLSVQNESMAPGPVSDSLETTRVLLDAGAAFDMPGLGGYTPLHWAAQHGKLDEARLLLEKGAALEGPPGHAVTPLAVAIAHCRPAVAALLVSKGAARNVKTGNGLPLREGACYGGYPEESDRRKIAELLR